MSAPNVLNTKMTSLATGRSILHELDPEDRAKAIEALKKVLDAVEDFGRVLHGANSKTMSMAQEIKGRASEIVRDAPVLAAYAYTGECHADRHGDRALAHAMGQIVGRARYLIHAAGGDRYIEAYYPQARDFPLRDDSELSLQLLKMTPKEMRAFRDREADARAALENRANGARTPLRQRAGSVSR